MELKKMIATRIKFIYQIHDYEINPDKLKYFIIILNDIHSFNAFGEKKILEFLKNVESGKYGILYKMPTSLFSMYQKFIEENKSKPTTSEEILKLYNK